MNVFYSWESDIPKQKSLIEHAIKGALKRLKKDDILDMDFDRDTKNKPGAIKIEETILQKISNCSIFIADISFVKNRWFVRNIVNQNVLFELGYAVKKLGYEKIILLFNTERGKEEDLPFDINHSRVLSFSPKKKKELGDDIYKSLKLIYETCDFRTIYEGWEKHDIDVLERILSDIPEKFDELLNSKLIQNRRCKSSELDYIHRLVERVDSNKNHLINLELRELADDLKTAFSNLHYKIAHQFAPDLNDSTYLVLDRPSYNDNGEYKEQYYNYLGTELPQSIQSAKDAYDKLCHRRTELFGI